MVSFGHPNQRSDPGIESSGGDLLRRLDRHGVVLEIDEEPVESGPDGDLCDIDIAGVPKTEADRDPSAVQPFAGGVPKDWQILLLLRFDAKEPEGLENSLVAHAEQDGVSTGSVSMPHPAGDDEEIPRLPIDLLIAGNRRAGAGDDVVDEVGGSAMRDRLLSGTQSAQPAVDRR